MPITDENLPNSELDGNTMITHEPRSTDPGFYQDLPQAIGAMSKSFADGHVIPFHAHERDQLLYAVSGIMRLRTHAETLVVPPDRAVHIPAGTHHSVSMHGDVEMRTLYIASAQTGKPQRPLSVLAVSGLLRELILALTEETVTYAEESRAGLIARLIEA